MDHSPTLFEAGPLLLADVGAKDFAGRDHGKPLQRAAPPFNVWRCMLGPAPKYGRTHK